MVFVGSLVVRVSFCCLRDGFVTQYFVTEAVFGSRSLDVRAVGVDAL